MRATAKKLSIKDFHLFMKGPFQRSMKRAFITHQIFCEADLQSFARRKIENFLAKNEEVLRKFRYGERKAIVGLKGTAARYFFEIPIVLEQIIGQTKVREWAEHFKPWSKYVLEKS